jgi:hypothetical protein
MNLTKVGTLPRLIPRTDGREKDLSKKADELGGKYFVVTSGEKNEKTSMPRRTSISNVMSGSLTRYQHPVSDHHSRWQADFPSGHFCTAAQTAIRLFLNPYGFAHGFHALSMASPWSEMQRVESC